VLTASHKNKKTMAETAVKEKESVFQFGKKERKLLTDPLNDNNPITVQVLGICSALAVTSLVYPSLVMAIAVIFVTAFSSLFTSLLRNYIPKSVRMIVQLVIIASLVTVVELTLKYLNYPVYKQLSVYIGLIITNCIVMGRLEAFSMANKPWRSFLDGVGNGLGYGVILVAVGVVRELFGKGSLFAGSPIELKIIGPTADYLVNTTDSMLFGWYANNNLMVLPASAMFIIGIMIWIQRSYNTKLVDVS
jgi:Na+-transporting NADH:ubiquinone oxidoreductase subunit D